MSNALESFIDSIWEEFQQTDQHENEWPDYFDEAVEAYESIRGNV